MEKKKCIHTPLPFPPPPLCMQQHGDASGSKSHSLLLLLLLWLVDWQDQSGLHFSPPPPSKSSITINHHYLLLPLSFLLPPSLPPTTKEVTSASKNHRLRSEATLSPLSERSKLETFFFLFLFMADLPRDLRRASGLTSSCSSLRRPWAGCGNPGRPPRPPTPTRRGSCRCSRSRPCRRC